MEYKLTYKQYYEGLKQGKILGLKCKDCGEYTVPPRIVCQECGSPNTEIKELSGTGTIKTYTIEHVVPEGFKPPLIVALVETDEGPWVMGNITGIEPEEATKKDLIDKRVKIGHKVITDVPFSGGEGITLTFSLI